MQVNNHYEMAGEKRQTKVGRRNQNSNDEIVDKLIVASPPPVQKRVSRALAIVDPTSGEEVCVKDKSDAIVDMESSEPCLKAADQADDPLSFDIKNLNFMSVALSLEGFQSVFPALHLPLDLGAELQGFPEAPAAPAKPTVSFGSSRGSPFSGHTPHPTSPSISSATNTSFGEDGSSGEDDPMKQAASCILNGPLPAGFWGTFVPLPALISPGF